MLLGGMKGILVIAGVILLLFDKLPAAPVDLSAPSATLGVADSHGNLELWREIDEVDFGRGLTLPLRIGFASDRQSSSPYLGRGWTCALLESKAFLKREKMMEAVLPCGKVMFLRRDRADASKFQTLDKVWTAVLNGDSITISRADGWELRYQAGLLRQLRTDTGRLINWTYSGNRATEVREQGGAQSGLRAEASLSGIPTGFFVNGKLHSFELEKRPMIKSEKGMNVVTSLDPSLSAWKWPDGTRETYRFAATKEVLPTLEVTDRQKVASTYKWDPATQHILSDGLWSYQVDPIDNPLQLPKIRRTNAAGQEEFSIVNLKDGIRDQKTLEDGHRITHLFTSPGKLFGKVRKVEEEKSDGKKVELLKLSYDANGRLWRKVDQMTIKEFDYSHGVVHTKSTLNKNNALFIQELKNKEKYLKEECKKASNLAQKDFAFYNLALFYISDERNVEKANDLAPTIVTSNLRYQVELLATNHNDKLTYMQKIKNYKELIRKYPDEKDQLNFLIKASDEMIQAGL